MVLRVAVLKAGRSLDAGTSVIEIDGGEGQEIFVQSRFEPREVGSAPMGDVTLRGTAGEDFLSDCSCGAVAWGAAVRAGWVERPGLPVPGAALMAAALDAAVATGAAELGVRFAARDDTLLLAMFCAATVVVASDESALGGAA